MASRARSAVVRNGVVATYHTWSRCVQRMYLLGRDPHTGVDYSERREIFEQLIRYQAGVFAVDVGNYSILSNHAHWILRTRPDLVRGWSDEEVATRWRLAWPKWERGRWHREPDDAVLRVLLEDEQWLQRARESLSNLSWFMARVKEPIAKLANAQAQKSGHVWEERFGAHELVDESELMTSMVYVDVNQIKAGMAQTLESSRHSAIAQRIAEVRQREAAEGVKKFAKKKSQIHEFSETQALELLEGSFLAPITTQGATATSEILAADEAARQRERIVIPLGLSDHEEPSSATGDTAEAETRSECHVDSANDELKALADELPLDVSEEEKRERLHCVLDPNRKKTYHILDAVFPNGVPARNSDVPILAMNFGDYLEKLTLVVEHYLKQERPAVESWREVGGGQNGSRETEATDSSQAKERHEASLYASAKRPEASIPKEVLQQLLGGLGQTREPPS